jgi:hypothetical protein
MAYFSIVFALIFAAVWIYLSFTSSSVGFGETSLPSWVWSWPGVLVLVVTAWLILVARNQHIRIEDGQVVSTDFLGRERLRVPLSEIVWVNVNDTQGDGWICRIETRRGAFRFTHFLQDYKELARTLDEAARTNRDANSRNSR